MNEGCIVVCGGLWHSIPVMLASRIARIPFFGYERGAMSPRICNLRGPVRKRLGKILIRVVYAQAHGLFFNSLGSMSDFQYLFESLRRPMAVVYSGINYLNEPVHRKHGPDHEQDRAVRGSPLKLLFVGRLSPAKNVSWLIKSLRNAVDKPVEFTIVGDGELRTQLIAEARFSEAQNPNLTIVFLGLRSEAEVRSQMLQSDVVLLASKWEGLPRVLLEAALCEVPIVSLDTKHGPAEILNHYELGVLVREAEAHLFWQAINQALLLRETRSDCVRPDVKSDSPFASFDMSALKIVTIVRQWVTV
jgi:glycosyltransferase involved in cell wall biosynthesis